MILEEEVPAGARPVEVGLIVREAVGGRERLETFGHVDAVPGQNRKGVRRIIDRGGGEVLFGGVELGIVGKEERGRTFWSKTFSQGSPVYLSIFIVSMRRASFPFG
jgi:hypothetical protein